MSREVTIASTESSVVESQAPSSSSRYVSIFEDPTRFGAQLKVAEALSRTQFVPKSFQGKPEDCLVALDMAARLELNPLAVFPDIYVIDGRASFSSKFLIALVNRSGRFSRIQFETGIDGEAEVTFGAWGEGRGQRKRWKEKIPNYYAVASFSELSSGNLYESPRVDMNFADKNGWFEKDGSKWRTMPEIMSRYRAASILIKSVCPEIVMGLEFAEDLQDAREDAPPRPVVVERRGATPTSPTPAPLLVTPSTPPTTRVTCQTADDGLPDEMPVAEMRRSILTAASVDELNARAKVIAEYELDANDAEMLRAAFRARRASLTSTKVASVIPDKTGLPGEEVFNVVAARGAIAKSTTQASLDSVLGEIEQARDDGRLQEEDARELLNALSKRRDEIVPEAVVDVVPDSDAQPTNEQLGFAEQLRGALIEAAKDKDAARLDKNGALCTDWAEQGYITPEQARELFAHYEELKRGVGQ